MAKMGCSVTLRKFVPNLAGYTQVKDTAPVQEILAGKAQRVKAAADASLGGDGHKVLHRRGKFDMGYVVATDSVRAQRAQAKRKTLTKGLGAAGGGA